MTTFSASAHFVECQECGATGPIAREAMDPICDPGAAFVSWNRREAINGMPAREATTYTTSYESAPFGSDSPLELVTLKSGEHELAVIPAKLLREIIEDLHGLLD